jgi:hypothetical protein
MTKKAIVGLIVLSVLFSWASWTFGQEGILRGPTPPLVINPERTPPKAPSPPIALPPPAVKPPAGTIPEKGVVNPRTGEFYPGTIGGVVNPQTGEVLPKVEGGYINPKTGELLPAQKWP